jgi:hypothetical protein
MDDCGYPIVDQLEYIIFFDGLGAAGRETSTTAKAVDDILVQG